MILDQKGIQAIEEAVQKVLSEFDLGEIKANEDQTNTFRVVASDETIDRDGETLIAKGCDFSHFLKNPVMFIDHSSWSVGNITAKATNIYVENNQVIIEGVFTDKTEAGRIANALYNDGFLKAVSVGFFIKKRNDKDSKIIEKWEIYECSFVSIPCNPNAISLDAKMYQKGLEMGLIKEEKQEEIKDEVKYATVEDMLRVESKLDKVLSLLDGKSAEENIDRGNKEVLQDIVRIANDRLHVIKTHQKPKN